MRRMIRVLAAAGVVAALTLSGCSSSNQAAVALDAGRDNAIGPADAAVTIEEWADFQCPACRNFAALQPRLDQTVLGDGSVRFVFRHMAFLGPESVLAAQAAECAGDQGRFWEYHDRLYASQSGENLGAFSAAHLKTLAGSTGIDQGAFTSCLDTQKYVSRVQQETQRGMKLGVTSTPTLVVNGQRVVLTTTRDPVETILLAVQTARLGKPPLRVGPASAS